MVSYTNWLSDNSLTARFRIKKEDMTLNLKVCKYQYLTQECSQYDLPSLQVHHDWHHVCFTLNSGQKDGTTMETVTSMFYDGKMVDKGKSVEIVQSIIYLHEILRIPFLKTLDKTVIVNDEFHELYAGGSFVIGQEQDGDQYGGFFDAAQGFSGKLAQVEMWNTELTLVDIFNIGNLHFESILS